LQLHFVILVKGLFFLWETCCFPHLFRCLLLKCLPHPKWSLLLSLVPVPIHLMLQSQDVLRAWGVAWPSIEKFLICKASEKRSWFSTAWAPGPNTNWGMDRLGKSVEDNAKCSRPHTYNCFLHWGKDLNFV
jgi:hypothetical protein